MRKGISLFLVIVLCVAITGCKSSRTQQDITKESALTPGMAKQYIYRGQTTQTEVLEIFGPPDLVTHKNGKDVWTYDKISHDVTSSSGFLTIFIAGTQSSRASRHSKSVMLIIYFDEDDVVQDYKLSAAKF